MKDDKEGLHLRDMFSFKKSISVETTDGNWLHHFYLPVIPCTESQGQLLHFQSKASSDSYIHYAKNKFKLSGGSTVLFKNVNGHWKHANLNSGKGSRKFTI